MKDIRGAESLAVLAEEAAEEAAARSLDEADWIFFGKVTISTATSVTVLPDNSPDGVVIGPLPLVGTKTISVNGRVCCLRYGKSVICIGKVVTP